MTDFSWPEILEWPGKFPDTVEEYFFDWTPYLPEGATVQSVTAEGTDGLVIDNNDQSDAVTRLVISGGAGRRPDAYVKLLATLSGSPVKPGANVRLPIYAR